MSVFWHQPSAERTLRQAARTGRLSRSYLFAGPDGVGKWAAALWVAQAYLCREQRDGEPCGQCRDCARVVSLTHPDLHLLFPVPGKARDVEDDSDEGAEPKSNAAMEFIKEFMEAKRTDPLAVVKAARKPTRSTAISSPRWRPRASSPAKRPNRWPRGASGPDGKRSSIA